MIVGGTRIPIELLDPAFAGIDDPVLEASIRAHLAEPGEPLPESGWRVFEQTERSVVVGSNGQGGQGWATIRFDRTPSGYAYRNSSFGQEPKPVPEERGRGLEMTFVADALRMQAGTKPSVQVRISNRGSGPIHEVLGHVHGGVQELSGDAVVHNPGPHYFTLMGHTLDLKAGQSKDWHVTFAACDLEKLSPGHYALTATLRELALTATGQLEVI